MPVELIITTLKNLSNNNALTREEKNVLKKVIREIEEKNLVNNKEKQRNAVSTLLKVKDLDLCKIDQIGFLAEKYRVSAEAEYLEENYEFADDKELLSKAEDVVGLMTHYNYTEEEAINEVMA